MESSFELLNIKMITAVNKKFAIGKNGKLPWHCKEDLNFFKKTTLGKTILVGSKTKASLPNLPGREVVTLSRNPLKGNFTSSQEVLSSFRDKELWIAGGSEVYLEFIKYTKELIISHIDDDSDGDAFFPISEIQHNFKNPPKLLLQGESMKVYRYERS